MVAHYPINLAYLSLYYTSLKFVIAGCSDGLKNPQLISFYQLRQPYLVKVFQTFSLREKNNPYAIDE